MQASLANPPWMVVSNYDHHCSIKEYIAAYDFIRYILGTYDTINVNAPRQNANQTFRVITEVLNTTQYGLSTYDVPPERIYAIWLALRQLHTELPISAYNYPNTTLVHHTFCDLVFSPIIPDSFALKIAQEMHDKDDLCSRGLHSLMMVLLAVEIPLRLLACFFSECGLSVYALWNQNFAQYYKFRIIINANYPASYLFKALFH